MRIGYDAKRAFQNNTGLGHYSRTLLQSLATYYPENKYILFAPKRTGKFDIKGNSAFEIITPQHYPAKLFRSAWRSSWVKRDLVKQQIDLYHGLSHEIPLHIKRTGIPAVVTIHDLIFERFPEQHRAADRIIYRKKFRYAATHANRVIAISEQTKKDLVELYHIPADKIDVCYQSCDASYSQACTPGELARVKETYRLPDRFFLSVGSIIERKNLLTICKSLELLRPESAIPLVVIGNGNAYQQKVKDFLKEANMENQVIFLSEQPYAKEAAGFANSADFPAIYQQALAMIYPSLYEGFGLPVLEALCSGLPVITSNSSCLPETGGDAALYVDPMDAQALAEAMFSVANQPALREEMIRKGYEHAKQFTPENCAASVMNVYKSIIP